MKSKFIGLKILSIKEKKRIEEKYKEDEEPDFGVMTKDGDVLS